MIRLLLAPLLALSLSGCVAAMAVGAATTVAGAAARGGGATEQETPPPLFHGYGENPNWAVTIFPQEMVFFSSEGSVTVPTPPSITTTEGHLYETDQLIVAISHQNCKHTPNSREFPELVRATVGGREYVGCGTEAQHADEAEE